MEKIAKKQKTEKKEPIILKDPTKSYHPEGNQTSLPITSTTTISGGDSIFGTNMPVKVMETKEIGSKPEEPDTETETKSSPEKTVEKVNFDKLSKTQFEMC